MTCFFHGEILEYLPLPLSLTAAAGHTVHSLSDILEVEYEPGEAKVSPGSGSHGAKTCHLPASLDALDALTTGIECRTTSGNFARSGAGVPFRRARGTRLRAVRLLWVRWLRISLQPLPVQAQVAWTRERESTSTTLLFEMTWSKDQPSQPSSGRESERESAYCIMILFLRSVVSGRPLLPTY